MKKCYYSDRHEKTEQKKHWSYHTNLYLTEIEPCCHRWISILPSELATMRNAKLDLFDPIVNDEYKYTTEDGVDHIDLVLVVA